MTNDWRRLADLPGEGLWRQVVWTGTTVLTMLVIPDPEGEPRPVLARYDLSTDTWSTDGEASYTSLVGVLDSDGVARTVLAMPVEAGAPVDVLDRAGNPIGSLPGHPVDLGGSGTGARGVWVGEEALFWISGAEWLLASEGSTELWAVDPATHRRGGRSLATCHLATPERWWPSATSCPWGGDVGRETSPGAVTDDSGGIAYRAPTTSTG